MRARGTTRAAGRRGGLVERLRDAPVKLTGEIGRTRTTIVDEESGLRITGITSSAV